MGFVRRHRLVLELALLALVAYLAGVGVTTGLDTAVDDVPPAPAEAAAAVTPHLPGSLADYALIAERDLFNPARGGGEGPRSHAGLRLWGVGLQGREARAVIEDSATHRQELYRVGDQVGGARIASIDWDRVTLEGDGGEEVLELAPPAAPPSAETPDAPGARADDRIRRTAENAFIVDRREVAGAVDNVSGLMTQLRAVAEVREGRPAGFRLFQIRDDSLFAKLGLRNGDVDDRVHGKVTIISPTRITPDEAYLVFQSVLQVKGFTTVPSGAFTKIVPAREAVASGARRGDEVVTRILPLGHAEASGLVPVLQPLVSKDGLLTAYPPTNSLVVVDAGANVDRLAALLADLDVPSSERATEVVALRFAPAEDTARRLRDSVGGQVLRVTADARTTALVLSGPPDEVRRARAGPARPDPAVPPGGTRRHVQHPQYAGAAGPGRA